MLPPLLETGACGQDRISMLVVIRLIGAVVRYRLLRLWGPGCWWWQGQMTGLLQRAPVSPVPACWWMGQVAWTVSSPAVLVRQG